EDDHITLASGKELPTDIVIMAIGVKADTELAQQSGIKLGKTGSIQVNQAFQTNLPHVYAVGDAIEVYQRLLRQPTRLNLAF
ncbi:pyridine nucleotide-disulfide oxidoreductase family protein, partial [Lacticaseibacillus rhamnosus MTCC 5462]